jgi:hypothetical protein
VSLYAAFGLQRFQLPPPTRKVIVVPDRWLSHKCPHEKRGLVLQFLDTGAVGLTENAPTTSLRWKDEEIESPSWWNNLDASKDLGYVAREQGRYGSYPSHDSFDDESAC